MKTVTYFVIYFFLITPLLSFSQQKTIPLWPEDIPGSIENSEYKLEVDSNETWTWMKYVSTPELDIYPAPAEIASGTAVIVCPGGGYALLAYKHEGSQVAEWFNSLGITAFVLKYRLPDDAIMEDKTIGPLQDGQKAMRIVRDHAKEWNIDPHRIGIMGFSAGGHFAATVSTHYSEDVYETSDTTSARPDFSILIYPVISMDTALTHMGSRIKLLGKDPDEEKVRTFSNELQVGSNTPPAFLVHSMDDRTVPVQNSINYALALQKYKISCELHIYQKGGHGYGLGRTDNTESTWPKACEKWLKAQGLL